MDIVEFLTSCVDEDERIAKAATQALWWYNHRKMWLADENFVNYDLSKGEEYVGYGEPPFSGCIAATGPANDAQSMSDAAHIASQGPLRTLRRVAAYRAILAEHGDQHECTDPAASDYPYKGCRTVKLLASEFSDRPGFNPQWSLT